MRTRDFREILADDLQDAEFRREYVIACYEQDGIEGLHMAFDEIARADASQLAKRLPRPADSASNLRTLLNQMGLDFYLVRLQATDNTLVAVQ